MSIPYVTTGSTPPSPCYKMLCFSYPPPPLQGHNVILECPLTCVTNVNEEKSSIEEETSSSSSIEKDQPSRKIIKPPTKCESCDKSSMNTNVNIVVNH